MDKVYKAAMVTVKPEVMTVLSFVQTQPDLFLAGMLFLAVFLSTNRIQMMIPGVSTLNTYISGLSFPIIGRMTLPGLLIIGGSALYLWVQGNLTLTIATGIGLAVITSAFRDRINLFPGPG